MQVGNYYKHDNNIDVGIKLFDIYSDVNKENYFCKVYWINISTDRHFGICSDNIIIKAKDLSKWKLYGIQIQY